MKITGVRGQARLGCVFLLAAALLLAATSFTVHPAHRPLVWVATTSGVDAVIAVVLWMLPWHRLGCRWLLMFPAAMTGTVATVGLATRGIAPAFIPLLSLSVFVIGISQPRWTTAKAAPLLGVTWWIAYSHHDPIAVIRLTLAVLVWLVLGETLSQLTQDHERESASLRAKAEIDGLTGLPNRHALDSVLPTADRRSSVLFLDLDHFKGFNDRYGHQAGDQLLHHFAEVLQSVLRGSDFAGRYGGEEFIVITDPTTDVTRLADRLQDAWRAAAGPVTCSIGAATGNGIETTRQVVDRADQALYAAKAAGRNTVVIAQSPASLPHLIPSPRHLADVAKRPAGTQLPAKI